MQEQHLGAEQADACRAMFEGAGGFLRGGDVGQDVNPMAISRRKGPAGRGGQACRPLAVTLRLDPVVGLDLGRWVRDDEAPTAIHEHTLARRKIQLKPRHTGNSK